MKIHTKIILFFLFTSVLPLAAKASFAIPFLNIKHKGMGVLHMAASQGMAELCQQLIDFGKEVNEEDENGLTSLHYAVAKGNHETISLLVANGADVNAGIEKNDITPLYAAMLGSEDIIELLLDLGADPYALIPLAGGVSASPLTYASYSSQEAIVRLFVKRGVDVNFQTPQGFTALHVMAILGKFDMVKLLLELGADVTLKDKDGLTAYDYATNYLEIADFLKPKSGCEEHDFPCVVKVKAIQAAFIVGLLTLTVYLCS